MAKKDKRIIPSTKLSEKRKLFLKYKMDNPAMSNMELLLKAGYHPKDTQSAAVMANRIMKAPEVQQKLSEHASVFESVILGTAKDWGSHEKPRQREIALNAAMFAYDHIFGKATVKIEQQVSVVKIAINLTGDGEDAPRDYIDAAPIIEKVGDS